MKKILTPVLLLLLFYTGCVPRSTIIVDKSFEPAVYNTPQSKQRFPGQVLDEGEITPLPNYQGPTIYKKRYPNQNRSYQPISNKSTGCRIHPWQLDKNRCYKNRSSVPIPNIVTYVIGSTQQNDTMINEALRRFTDLMISFGRGGLERRSFARSLINPQSKHPIVSITLNKAYRMLIYTFENGQSVIFRITDDGRGVISPQGNLYR